VVVVVVVFGVVVAGWFCLCVGVISQYLNQNHQGSEEGLVV